MSLKACRQRPDRVRMKLREEYECVGSVIIANANNYARVASESLCVVSVKCRKRQLPSCHLEKDSRSGLQ
jgi:hypothetical protein